MFVSLSLQGRGALDEIQKDEMGSGVDVVVVEGSADSVSNVKVYDFKERTKLFSLAVIKLCSPLMRDAVSRVMAHQLLRSATSVGANYREADFGRSNAEFVAKIGDCLREASESVYWIELLIESGIGERVVFEELKQEAEELVKILYLIKRNAKRNPKV